ncbi:AP2/ERF and B3 domain-containing transcription repressor RAV2-like isoform X1 [Vitis riparia]|uniref:AP2/ERF and B3 domain-containing transcription repressor RAV2-like isoform X1 n=1 Tax=Vitis riparia TaxID=96939 RepID=UPI00155A493E|nr:AP2/ERF and B3 domain-containing transcription repressor RAV2-like isoform X1 [Vitis riparia]
MSQKRDGSASPSDEEMKKKVKLDASSSSGSASVIGTPTNEDGSKPLMESSASFPDEEKKKKKKKKEKRGSSSASCTGKDQSFGKMNRRTLLYKKSLTLDDVTKFKIMIPLESGRKFLAEPEKIDGKYQSKMVLLMDHDQQIWPMEVSFEELSSSYVLCLNWDKYFRRYELEAEDVIFLYFDPEIPSFGHFLIEYEKKGCF